MAIDGGMIIRVIDKFGHEREIEIDHYVYHPDYKDVVGLDKIELYIWDDVGVYIEIIGENERKRARARLIGILNNIAGFYIEVEDGAQEEEGSAS